MKGRLSEKINEAKNQQKNKRVILTPKKLSEWEDESISYEMIIAFAYNWLSGGCVHCGGTQECYFCESLVDKLSEAGMDIP